MTLYLPSEKSPRRLILIDGELRLSDGGDVRQYLREYAKFWEISAGHSMVLVTSDEYDALHATREEAVQDALIDAYPVHEEHDA